MDFAVLLTLIVIFTHIVGSLQTNYVAEFVWQLWTNYAPSNSIKALRATRNELVSVRQERSNTSSQDEFAKWARLDREYQRLKKEYDTKNSEVSATRQRLTQIVRIFKWGASKGLLWAFQWKYRKHPVVWLPLNSVPYRLEWFLALPAAPLGSLSVVTWVLATNTMISTSTSLYRRAALRRKVRA